MITSINCGTCGPKNLNIEKPQGPKATSFTGAPKVNPENFKKTASSFLERIGKAFKFVADKVKPAKDAVVKFFGKEGGFSKIADSAIKMFKTAKESIVGLFSKASKPV